MTSWSLGGGQSFGTLLGKLQAGGFDEKDLEGRNEDFPMGATSCLSEVQRPRRA